MKQRTNQFQATGSIKQGGQVAIAGVYPLIPPMWPSRKVRRAVKYGEHRLPAGWAHVLVTVTGLRKHLKSL